MLAKRKDTAVTDQPLSLLVFQSDKYKYGTHLVLLFVPFFTTNSTSGNHMTKSDAKKRIYVREY